MRRLVLGFRLRYHILLFIVWPFCWCSYVWIESVRILFLSASASRDTLRNGFSVTVFKTS